MVTGWYCAINKLLLLYVFMFLCENLFKGLFMHQQLDIADYKSRVQFNAEQVEMLPIRTRNNITYNITAIKPACCWQKKCNRQLHLSLSFKLQIMLLDFIQLERKMFNRV